MLEIHPPPENEIASVTGEAAPTQRQMSAALPVCFNQTVGLFTPDAGLGTANDIAVLFASPWGLEDLSARKFFRIIAEALSYTGIPSLRFDYPGTGDAINPPDYQAGMSVYEDSLVAAAACLRQLSGRKRIVVVAQGLGTLLALRATGIAADGIALVAPVVSGRAYLRELGFWAKVVDDSLALAEEHRQTSGVSIASFSMPPEIADQLRKVNFSTLPEKLPTSVLVTERPERPGDTDFADRLSDAGAQVTKVAFEGYDAFVSNPTLSKIPLDVVAGIIDWAKGIKPTTTQDDITPPSAVDIATTLSTPDFRETPLRFGEADRLYGIMCEPVGPRTGATVVLLSSAYDRHAGWGRLTVTTARRLAQAGIPSLRFDCANVADSPPLAGAPDQVLYSFSQMRDQEAAMELVAARDLLPVIAYGRCSGGYLAYQSVLADQRWKGLVTVNPPTFYWNPEDDVTQVLVAIPRSLEAYSGRAFKMETYKRLFNGSLNTRQALSNILTAIAKRLQRSTDAMALPFWGGKKRKLVDDGFKVMSSRALRVELIYSDNDPGHIEHLLQFGETGHRMKHYSNVNVTLLARTDHNITPETSQAQVFEILRDTAISVGTEVDFKEGHDE